MPAKGEQEIQKAFKKADSLLDIADMILYVQDETKIRVESNNYHSWSPIGKPHGIERNGNRKGVNVISVTEISKKFDSIVNIYSSDEKMGDVVGHDTY